MSDETEEPYVITQEPAPEISDVMYPVPPEVLDWEAEHFPPQEEEPT